MTAMERIEELEQEVESLQVENLKLSCLKIALGTGTQSSALLLSQAKDLYEWVKQRG